MSGTSELFGVPYVSRDMAVKDDGLQYEIHVDVFNPFTGSRLGAVVLDAAADMETAEHFAAQFRVYAAMECTCGTTHEIFPPHNPVQKGGSK